MSNARQLIDGLMQRIGLGEVEYEDDIASAKFDDMILNFQVDDEVESVMLFLALGDVPADTEKRESLLMHALRANAFGIGTGGGVIGVDEQEKTFVFSYRFSTLNWEQTRFDATVEEFLNLAEKLIADLAARDAAPTAGNDTPSAPPFSENNLIRG